MPKPYSEPNPKEEITPEEYAAEKDVGRGTVPNEYVTSGSAPQEFPSRPNAKSTDAGSESDRRNRAGKTDDDEENSNRHTTTGHAPQRYPATDQRQMATTPPTSRQLRAQNGGWPSHQTQRVADRSGAHFAPSQQRPNVDQTERQIAVVAGGALLLHALFSRSPLRMLTGALGGALIWHGQSQRSPIYEAFDLNSARSGQWRPAGQPSHQEAQRQRTQPPVRPNAIEIERAVTVNKSAEELYTYWRKLENLPNFMEHLERVEQLDQQRSRWTARLLGGLPVSWEAEITSDQPNRQIAWQTLPDAQVEQRGTVTFKPATGERGTVVHVDIRYTPPGGVIGETFARLLNGVTAQQVKDDIRRFKNLMETGVIPTVEGQPSGRA